MVKKEEEKTVKLTKFLCPVCGKFSVTKSNPVIQCGKCHHKFIVKKPIIIKEIEI
jgi:transcription elongation factor Elf1